MERFLVDRGCCCLSGTRERFWRKCRQVDGLLGTGSYDEIVPAVNTLLAGDSCVLHLEISTQRRKKPGACSRRRPITPI